MKVSVFVIGIQLHRLTTHSSLSAEPPLVLPLLIFGAVTLLPVRSGSLPALLPVLDLALCSSSCWASPAVYPGEHRTNRSVPAMCEKTKKKKRIPAGEQVW